MYIQAQSDLFSQGIFIHMHGLATKHGFPQQMTAQLS